MKFSDRLEILFLPRCVVAAGGLALILALAGSASAQAPAGPMKPPPAGAAQEDSPPPSAGRASARIGGKPAMAGEWKLNRQDSDDPRQRLQQANSGSRRGGWGGGPGGPGGGSGGPGGQSGPGGGGGYGGRGQGGNSEEANNMMSDLSYLTVRQTEKTISVQSDSGRLLAQYPPADQGNSKSDDPQTNKGASSQWQGESLVVVTPGKNGGKTTRTFELSSDSSQLYMTTRMEGGRLNSPVTFRLVYDPSNQ